MKPIKYRVSVLLVEKVKHLAALDFQGHVLQHLCHKVTTVGTGFTVWHRCCSTCLYLQSSHYYN